MNATEIKKFIKQAVKKGVTEQQKDGLVLLNVMNIGLDNKLRLTDYDGGGYTIAKQAGVCHKCHLQFKAGDTIGFQGGGNTRPYHPDCLPSQ